MWLTPYAPLCIIVMACGPIRCGSKHPPHHLQVGPKWTRCPCFNELCKKRTSVLQCSSTCGWLEEIRVHVVLCYRCPFTYVLRNLLKIIIKKEFNVDHAMCLFIVHLYFNTSFLPRCGASVSRRHSSSVSSGFPFQIHMDLGSLHQWLFFLISMTNKLPSYA